MKTIRYRLEALAATALYRLFAALPRRRASWLGGMLGRGIGRVLPQVGKTAERNLIRIWPEMPTARRRQILSGVWDNIGRVAAELPHVVDCRIGPGADIMVDGANVLAELRTLGKPLIFVGAHLANWEIFAHVAAHHGLPVIRVYRAANNQLIEDLIQTSRRAVPGGCIPKGSAGAREILKALKAGQHLGFLVDQRMSDGETVPFFGLPARTATAPVDLALRFGCPIIPAQCIRLEHSRFQVVVHPPLWVTPDTRDSILVQVNAMIETWIRQHPEQWLWVHNRWKM